MDEMTEAILPVRQFSIAEDMAMNDSEIKFEGLAEALVKANEASQMQANDLAKIADGPMGPMEMIDMMKGMHDIKTRAQIFSLVVTEATKGFKTLTQQS